MPGTLFVVATPIGNLEDVTLRALRVLREADLIAAEDTRRTARLLAHHGIPTPTLSFHTHNWRGRVPQLLARLENGQSVAVVTDAGTPGISDPGIELVQACVEAGVPVEPIPGASAPIVAAVASGFPLSRLTVLGFPPFRSKDRADWIAELAALPGTVVFFEAPHRIVRTLEDLTRVLGERQMCLGREMTKVHQEFLRGTADELFLRVNDKKGEFTVVIGPPVASAVQTPPVEDDEIAAEFGRITELEGLSRRQALHRVAGKFGKRPNDIYSALERVKRTTS